MDRITDPGACLWRERRPCPRRRRPLKVQALWPGGNQPDGQPYLGRIASERAIESPFLGVQLQCQADIGGVSSVATSQLRGDRRHGRTILDEVEWVELNAEGGHVGPGLDDAAGVDVPVESQPCKNIGDLVREHCRSVQLLT